MSPVSITTDTHYYIRNVQSKRYLRVNVDGKARTGPRITDSLHLWRFYKADGNKYRIENVGNEEVLYLGDLTDSKGDAYATFTRKWPSEGWNVDHANDCAQAGAITFTLPSHSVFLYANGEFVKAIKMGYEDDNKWAKTHWILESAGPS